jgi:hypothetical protein
VLRRRRGGENSAASDDVVSSLAIPAAAAARRRLTSQLGSRLVGTDRPGFGLRYLEMMGRGGQPFRFTPLRSLLWLATTSLPKQWWPRSTHGGGFQPFRLPARRSKPRCLSGLLFGRQRAYCVLAGEQRTWVSPAAIPADRGRLRKGVDMFWNIGTIGRHGMQRTAFPNERAAKLVKSQELGKASPAFEAWLQAYREHLAEDCQCANYRPASPANANG